MDTEKITSFTDLNAWKEAHKFVLMIYKITRNFPKEEMFGLISQIRRAVVSIVSNADKGQFYTVALGSLTEVQSQLMVARDLDYLSNENFTMVADQGVVVSKLLNGLIKSSRYIHNS